MVRYKEKRMLEGRKELSVFLKACFWWGSSYVAMFCTKWLLSFLLLGRESLTETFAQTKERIEGNPFEAVITNLRAIFPVSDQISGLENGVLSGIGILALLAVTVQLIILYRRKEQTRSIAIILLFLLWIPYLRFFIISNHAAIHSFFTYRAQLVSVLIGIISIGEIVSSVQCYHFQT